MGRSRWALHTSFTLRLPHAASWNRTPPRDFDMLMSPVSCCASTGFEMPTLPVVTQKPLIASLTLPKQIVQLPACRDAETHIWRLLSALAGLGRLCGNQIPAAAYISATAHQLRTVSWSACNGMDHGPDLQGPSIARGTS